MEIDYLHPFKYCLACPFLDLNSTELDCVIKMDIEAVYRMGLGESTFLRHKFGTLQE